MLVPVFLGVASLIYGQQPEVVQPQDPTAAQNQAPNQAETPKTPAAKRGERPLTPEEIREKQIQMFDPLNKTNPLVPEQEQPAAGGAVPPLEQKPRTQPTEKFTPLPGSVAASRNTGPQVTGDTGGDQDYAGPAVLSRSYTLTKPQVPNSVQWAPSLGFTEIYDSSIPQLAQANGTSGTRPSPFGYGLSWGVAGRHHWKRDAIDLRYTGGSNKYGAGTGYNGTNQSLNLVLTHVVSRHIQMNLVSAGSIQSASAGLVNNLTNPETSIANVNLAATPVIQLLDQNIRQWMNQVSVTWQKSARLSFNGGGGVFFVDRSGTGLQAIGNTGYQAQGDVNYRFTRRTTVGVYYSYTSYQYSHQISLADFHTLGGIYSYAFNRLTQLRLRAGESWLENQGQQLVPLNPLVASLTGQAVGVVESYSRHTTADVSADLARDFGRNRTGHVSYVRGVAPGNGLLQTSTQETFLGSFSTRLFRDYTLTFAGGKVSTSAVVATAGRYSSEYAGVTITHSYRHGLAGTLGFDYRKVSLTNQPMLHSQYRITSTISWNPGENWLKSW